MDLFVGCTRPETRTGIDTTAMNLLQLGGFDPELGMRGKQIGVAEETALLKSISERVLIVTEQA